LCVALHKQGQKVVSVHRLVAFAFLPKPQNKNLVNHKNGIKHDNCVNNLEWCTAKENNSHADRTGLNKHIQKENSRTRKLSFKDIKYVCKHLELSSGDLSKKFKVTRGCITQIRRKNGINSKLRKKLLNDI